jgi:hypothetical protein
MWPSFHEKYRIQVLIIHFRNSSQILLSCMIYLGCQPRWTGNGQFHGSLHYNETKFCTKNHCGMANNTSNRVFNFVTQKDDFTFFLMQKWLSFVKQLPQIRCKREWNQIQFPNELDYVGWKNPAYEIFSRCLTSFFPFKLVLGDFLKVILKKCRIKL